MQQVTLGSSWGCCWEVLASCLSAESDLLVSVVVSTDGIDGDKTFRFTGEKCRQSPSETGLGLFLDSVAIRYGRTSTVRPHHMSDAYHIDTTWVSDDGISQAEAQRTGPALRQLHNTSAQQRPGRGQGS